MAQLHRRTHLLWVANYVQQHQHATVNLELCSWPALPADEFSEEVPPQLELLKGITGYAEPGMLTALMGGSGEWRGRVGLLAV
jgi:hypothetical protein